MGNVSRGFGKEDLYEGIENKKTVVFYRSATIASYLYALIAGPYESIENNVEGFVPMRMFMRASTMKKMSQDLISEHFLVTQTGMQMYKELFGVAYPFKKYDQILVPEFNSGAMENVGAVTFNEERFKIGTQITESERVNLANINLHELAHHWFGNLVAIKWWNDLWLNESFATYLSYLVQTISDELAHIGEPGAPWMNFLSMKLEGFQADSHSTTHPVRNSVDSLQETESIFDGISYGKGASYLKQINKVYGTQALSRALTKFFKKY